jgi:hypothetical protein
MLNSKPLTQEIFDVSYADEAAALMATHDWQGLIDLSVELVTNHSPNAEMRVELLTTIAMAQVGMATDFTENLRQKGELLRNQLAVMPEEASRIIENVTTIIKLRADGFQATVYPDSEGN